MQIPIPTNNPAQIRDQIIIDGRNLYGNHYAGGGFHTGIFRFNRKLELLGMVDYTKMNLGYGNATYGTSVFICPNGDFWLNDHIIDPQTSKAEAKLFRFDSKSRIVDELDTSIAPALITSDRIGNVYVVGTPSNATIVAYALMSKWSMYHQEFWQSADPTKGFIVSYPGGIITGGDGAIWFWSHPITSFNYSALATKTNPDDGRPEAIYRPSFTVNGSIVFRIQAMPASLHEVWIQSIGGSPLNYYSLFELTDGITTSKSWFIYYAGLPPNHFRVGPTGKLFFSKVPFGMNPVGEQSVIAQVDSTTGIVEKEWDLKRRIFNFTFGPTGEEIFALTTDFVVANKNPELVKLNLVTGQQSALSLWQYKYIDFPDGDPTGYIRATILDPNGDSDFDGYKNYEEVLNGYNPYDPYNHPGGPKVYVWFDANANNSLNVKYVDPDGIIDIVGGLDPASFSLILENASLGPIEVFTHALAGAQSITLSPDGKELTIDFGQVFALPGGDIGVTASVADKTGAKAWDWHKVP
ncbi:MAG: hypothetical protein HY286_06380 [Planctomycetes bacterium]|nr:hypothetical protein [Planctomycetota bacterium]